MHEGPVHPRKYINGEQRRRTFYSRCMLAPSTHAAPAQELDPRGSGNRRYISPDLLRFEHGGEAALVFTPPVGTSCSNSGTETVAVLAFNLLLASSAGAAADATHLQLQETRLMFLANFHYYHCRPIADLHILVWHEDVVGAASGACGQLLGFNPAGEPGFMRCNVSTLGNLILANEARQVCIRTAACVGGRCVSAKFAQLHTPSSSFMRWQVNATLGLVDCTLLTNQPMYALLKHMVFAGFRV